MAESVVRAVPEGLSEGGLALWSAFAAATMPAAQVALLLEACRAKDRLDKLDLILRGEVDTWARLVHRTLTEDYELHIDDALVKANATASSLRQLLAALPADAQAKPQVKSALDELRDRRATRGANATRAPRAPRATKRS
ncbi:MAG TPA: hypothetical protein VGL75_07375 [Acidothermaceae bacterium]|jgi:hypothetical protein